MVMKQRTEERMDQDLAFLLRYENIAWYEDGVVKILDRRIYPIRVEHVICKTYAEVAEAIRKMVTQSEGPYIAAAMGMVLAVQEVKDRTKERSWRRVMKQRMRCRMPVPRHPGRCRPSSMMRGR